MALAAEDDDSVSMSSTDNLWVVVDREEAQQYRNGSHGDGQAAVTFRVGKGSSSHGFCHNMQLYTMAQLFGFVLLAVLILLAALTAKGHDGGPDDNGVWVQSRLPRSVSPVFYDLSLTPDMDAETFDGTVKMSLSVQANTDTIVLHARDLVISNVQLQVDDDDRPVSHFLFAPTETLVVRTKVPLSTSDATVYLTVTFSGTMYDTDKDGKKTDKLNGFYISRYTDSSQHSKKLATTQFESAFARRAFPCFDEPDRKARFAITLFKPKGYVALSNMPPKYPADNTRMVEGMVEFETSLRMSTYLVAFILCDFHSDGTTTSSNIQVGVWAPPSKLQQAEYALHVAADTIPYYESFFEAPYPLPKEDLISIPDFAAGAMENWGLITYRETAMLYDAEKSSAANKQRVAVVVAHELGHQWFGNLVTLAWWNDLWLNEGFASWLEYKGVANVEPDWQMESQFLIEAYRQAQTLDAKDSTHPLSVPASAVQTQAQIEAQFDSIAYDKVKQQAIEALFCVPELKPCNVTLLCSRPDFSGEKKKGGKTRFVLFCCVNGAGGIGHSHAGRCCHGTHPARRSQAVFKFVQVPQRHHK
eukprot:m.130157 g.130157  ORF g.130157 m.130157 type:complete len:587 (+) comp16779_c0_seq3:154-1914(+)